MALAHGAAAEDIQVARKHYRRASTLYDLRRYREAAKEYEAAYEAKDDPSLLFNIGQSYRLANEAADALASYRAYLRRMPTAPNCIEVEVFIEELQKTVDQQKKAQEAKPAETQPVVPAIGGKEPAPRAEPVAAPAPETPPSSPGRTKRIAGIAFGALAQSISKQFTTPANPGMDRFDPSLDARGGAFEALQIAGLAIGGAAVVTGVALFVVGHRESRRVAIAPSVGSGAAGLSLSGSCW